MGVLEYMTGFKKISTLLLIVFLSVAHASVSAQAADKVTTYQDSNGWKLKVNGKDFYVKGVVWGYTPRNENYTYNLWSKPDALVQKVLDHDFGLMQKAGVNAVRSFATIPPKWVTYIYRKYGIMTAINPLMGRYGVSVGGVWKANTDYSDPATRKVLKDEVLKQVRTYKNVPGVLMFALGNESNYGLSWKSFEIENLPQGEQNIKKADYLYSLFAEVIDAGKKIDSSHPFTIVNGDIQYIDLIAKYGKNWDLLGTNAYRGISFTKLWQDVKAKYGKPVLLFEFGSDAFNAREFKEDEAGQANLIKGQWQEMYNKSYGKGEQGNSLGGFIFEWRDEWWKFKQTENLDKHDRNASWSNGGYSFDFTPGVNNMNEEWFGITRLGKLNKEGFYPAHPRMAYDVLAEIWRVDLYKTPKAKVNQVFSGMNMAAYKAKSEQRLPEELKREAQPFRVTGGRVKVDALSKQLGDNDSESDQGAMAFLDFAVQAGPNFEADFTLNAIASASDSAFEFKYGDRLNPEDGEDVSSSEKVEIYDFQATYRSDYYDLLGFYHVPRYHWGDKGDFFGLLRETTDMDNQDIWNAKAPAGVEFIGKKSLDGLTIVTGPEVYWGANPKAIVKYQFGPDKRFTFMHSEDVDTRDSSDDGGTATARNNRQTTLQAKFEPKPGVNVEVGGIISGAPQVDRKFDRLVNGNVVEDRIYFEDTLGLKAKISFDAFAGGRAYIAASFAGLVADGGQPFRDFGTELPYAELGNKREVEAGLRISKGNYTFYPRLLYRDNLVDANPLINPSISGTVLTPGIEPRNMDIDPFAVLDNRAARAAEFYVTYDPTPGTFFYDWDNDVREDAKFAYNFGVTATQYKTMTDSYLFFYEEGGVNAAFGEGLAAEDVWLAKSKMVFNVSPNFKAIAKIEAGRQQPTGKPADATKFYGLEGKFIFNDRNIVTAKYKKDGWGPYDFQRQFDLTYPEQVELGYTRLLDKGQVEGKSSKAGVKLLYRTLDEKSPGDEFYQNGTDDTDGTNDDMFEAQVFYEYRF